MSNREYPDKVNVMMLDLLLISTYQALIHYLLTMVGMCMLDGWIDLEE